MSGDTLITDLDPLTDVADEDLFHVVDDPSGTPLSKKATAGTIRQRAYGSIYVADGVATQNFTATTPAKLTLFAADGPSLNTTPAHGSDQITVTNAGVYEISAQFSITHAINNTLATFHVAVDGVTSVLGCHRLIGTGTDAGSCSVIGHLSLTAGQVISINAEFDKTGNLTLIDGQLNVKRI